MRKKLVSSGRGGWVRPDRGRQNARQRSELVRHAKCGIRGGEERREISEVNKQRIITIISQKFRKQSQAGEQSQDCVK